jgi:hypothetical protein
MICAGIVGLIKDSNVITDTAFDILSLEALFMVPRYDWRQRSFRHELMVQKDLFAIELAPIFRDSGM